MKLKCCVFFILVMILNSCQKNDRKEIQINFYHWTTVFSLNKNKQTLLKKLDTKKLYTKYFDIAFNPNTKNIEYKALINFKKKPRQIIVPCVFITNSTFKHIKDVESFAEQVYLKIQHVNLKSAIKIREIQIDCDWNSTTQKKYFTFLKSLKEYIKKDKLLLSATIRLHQIKYKNRTGIPPVEKGYLMCYNMGDIENTEESNSIYQEALLKDYTKVINDYPMDLNLAIPLYSWGLVYRFGKLVEIINDLTEDDFKLKTSYSKRNKNNFLLEENQYLKNSYLYKDDLIRIEKTSLKMTRGGIQWLYNHMENKPEELLFYHLKSNLIKSYDSKDFKDYIVF